MIPVLVDSNVILDIAIADSPWRAWSASALSQSAENRSLIINPIIYAEVSVGFLEIADVDTLVDEAGLTREDLPWGAAFLAGKASAGHPSRTSSSGPMRRYGVTLC